VGAARYASIKLPPPCCAKVHAAIIGRFAGRSLSAVRPCVSLDPSLRPLLSLLLCDGLFVLSVNLGVNLRTNLCWIHLRPTEAGQINSMSLRQRLDYACRILPECLVERQRALDDFIRLQLSSVIVAWDDTCLPVLFVRRQDIAAGAILCLGYR
jgi:hypothetical protein